MKYIKIFFLIILFTGCASYKTQISSGNQTPYPQNKELEHRFYLIGDAGNSNEEQDNNALELLKEKIENEGKKSTVIFLGDNVYPNGFPPKDNEEYNVAKYRLDQQINALDGFKGSTLFIPGNHDWYSNGVKGLKREQEYIESKLGKKSFLPKNGCPIEVINISEEIVLIIVDSQWYITNWDNHPTINEDCEIRTRNQFFEEFRSEIKKAIGKTTLVAIHHPMFTNGQHAGNYSFGSNFKPFPVFGTLRNLIRKTSGISNADISNKFYNELRKNLIAAAQYNDKVVFLSGHEHNLQYLNQDNLHQIISGSGSKTSPLRISKNGKFGSAKNGFAILDVFKDGSSFVQYVNANDKTIPFQTTVLPENEIRFKGKNQPIANDSITTSIYSPEETSKGVFYEALWGKRYRNYYSTPIKAKVVNLDTLYGGLKPVRKGGGNQSKALRLINPEGKQYVMRAMKKSASQYIEALMFKNEYMGGQFQNTTSEALIKDLFTGSHPYAPFTTATMSDAIGIYHLNSKLYYIPKQDALGDFNSEFGDELYLFEEHASDGHNELGGQNFTGKIISTQELLEALHSDEDVIVDEENYIRARLFDMLIGDWDRHQDQWRWMEFKENRKKVYRPLPRDRDQPFSKMSDGFVLSAAVKLIPAAHLLKKYDSDLKDVKGFNTEPYPLDMALIVNSDKNVWDNQVKLIQDKISDEVVNNAFKNMPKEVRDETVNEIKKTLKDRLQNLQKIADRYFSIINKYTVITATNKDDFIKIETKKNNDVVVSISRKKDNTIKDEYHNKIYSPSHTKEIWIYGLDDDDTFEVVGKSNKIKIRLIGGQNNDSYKIENGKNVFIYDHKSKKNDVAEANNAAVKLNDSYDINTYDFKKLKTNTNQIIPVIGINPDDGLKIGVNNIYTIYGFERNPFTTRHQIKAAYYFATSGYELNYKGEFANIVGNTNLIIQSKFNSPNFSINFFGYGNETQNSDDEKGMNYNRVKVRELNFAPSLVWKAKGGAEVSFGVKYESIEVQNSPNRFVENNPQLPDYIYDRTQFLGYNSKFSFENYDNKAYPTLGMASSVEIGQKFSLENSKRNFTYLIPEISFTHKLESSGKLILATKFKGQVNFSDNFEFYQAASLGGNDGLRGYRNQRFTGKQSLYQMTDIRYSFSRIKTKLIPVRIGMYGGFDYGRVWYPNDFSKKWNNSFGGGFFMNGAELLTANLGAFHSADGIRMAFSLGFNF